MTAWFLSCFPRSRAVCILKKMKLTATVTFGREETSGAAHFSAEQAKIQVWLAADFWFFFLGNFEASLSVAFPISFSTSYGLQTEAR